MNLSIIEMSSIGIDFFLTLRNEMFELYLLGQEDERSMTINGQNIILQGNEMNDIIRIVNEFITIECLLYITTDIYNDLVMSE